MPLLNADQLKAHPDFVALLRSLDFADLRALPAVTGPDANAWRTHKSFHGSARSTLKRQMTDPLDNEELSFDGDAFLSLQLARLVREDGMLRTGALTSIKGAFESNETLAKLSVLYGLPSLIRAHGHQKWEFQHNARIQADLFEARLGAVCLSRGDAVVAKWIDELYRPLIKPAVAILTEAYRPSAAVVHASWTAACEQLSFAPDPPLLVGGKPGAMRLEEWRVGRGFSWLGRKDIVYSIEQVPGTAPHLPLFTGHVVINGVEVGIEVEGTSKKAVRHQVAHNALIEIDKAAATERERRHNLYRV